MSSINVEIYPKEGESQEQLLKRFIKKCKKEKILEEHIDKTSFHRTKSEKRRFKRKQRQIMLERNKKKYLKYRNR